MEAKTQRDLLIARVRSQLSLVVERLGGANPYGAIDLTKLSDEELGSLSKELHELMYSPPPRR